MSNSVVPAAAAVQAKQLVRNKKLVKRAQDQKPAQDQQQVADKEDDAAHAIQVKQAEHLQASMSDTSLSSDFSFAGALSAAADSASLVTESSAQDEGGWSGDDGDGAGGTILLVGAIGLAGLGVAVLADGGSGEDAPNAPPAFANDSLAVTTDEDEAVQVTVSATDPDGDLLAYSVSTNPANGTVTGGANGVFTYTPNADYFGADSFVVTVADGRGGTDTITINVTINPVNDAPRPTDDNTSELVLDEDTEAEFIIDFFDPEDGAEGLEGEIISGPANGVIDFSNAPDSYTYIPNPNFFGTDSITYKVTDQDGASTEFTISITVNPVNDDPTADPTQSVSTTEGAAVIVTVEAEDVDGDELTYTVEEGDGPANGTVEGGEDGVFTYTPGEGYIGSDSFTVTIDDGNGGVITQVVNVSVAPDVPVISLDIGDPTSDTPAIVDASDGAFILTDDAAENTHVRITGFTDDDIIVTTAVLGQYSFGTAAADENDLEIIFRNTAAGKDNIILLDDVLPDGALFANNYAAVADLIGFDFMTFA